MKTKELPRELIEMLDRVKISAELQKVVKHATEAIHDNFHQRFDKYLETEKRKRIISMRWVVRTTSEQETRSFFIGRVEAENHARRLRRQGAKKVVVMRVTRYRKEKTE